MANTNLSGFEEQRLELRVNQIIPSSQIETMLKVLSDNDRSDLLAWAVTHVQEISPSEDLNAKLIKEGLMILRDVGYCKMSPYEKMIITNTYTQKVAHIIRFLRNYNS